MKHAEFRKRLDRLHEVLVGGLHYYAVWKNLLLHDPSKVSWSLEEQSKVLGRFLGFMTPVALALHDMALMEFAKLFDTNRRTASLINLLSAARQDPSLIPRANAGDIDEVCARLQHSEATVTRLKRKRDQELAHIYPRPLRVGPIRSTELDTVVDDVKSAFIFLSTAHDGRVVSWDHSLRTADRGTNAVLRLLVEEIERRQKQHDDEMVRIALEEARRREAVMGRRLDSEELLSIKQSFGFTDEQMELIERQYART